MPATEAHVVWKEGMQFVGTASASGHPVALDSAPDVGGQGQGARPMELLLIGLGGCTGMDVISILRKMRQQVTGYEVVVKGQRAEGHPRVYTDIVVEHVVRGRSLDPAMVEKAVRLSETKYCPASAMLSKAATVHHTVRIIQEATAH